MGNTCCSGMDVIGKEIRCEVDVYQDRMGRQRELHTAGQGSDTKKQPIQASLSVYGDSVQ